MEDNIAARLDRAIKVAGVPIVGVSIGNVTDKTTWTVQPESLQNAAQSIIDGFDPNAQSVLDADIASLAQQSSREKNRLADIALMIRHKDITVWNKMSEEQRIVAIQAQQTLWKDMRDFVEKNL